MAGMRPPIESVRCRRCGEMGHYTSQCKKSNNQANAFYDAHDLYDQNQESFGFHHDDDDDDNDFESMFVAIFDLDLHSSKTTSTYKWCEKQGDVNMKDDDDQEPEVESLFNSHSEYVGGFYHLLMDNEDDDKDILTGLWDGTNVTRTGYVIDPLFHEQDEHQDEEEKVEEQITVNLDVNDTFDTLLFLEEKEDDDLSSNHTSHSGWNEVLQERAQQEFETLHGLILNEVSDDHEEQDALEQELILLKESVGDLNLLEGIFETEQDLGNDTPIPEHRVTRMNQIMRNLDSYYGL